MPFALILSALVAVVSYQLLSRYRALSRNLALAKSTGLPIVVTPWNVLSVFWLATHNVWRPLMRKLLPQSQQGLWLDLMDPEWAHKSGFMPFEKLGADVINVVSPTSLVAYVASAEAVTQITTRRNDFPKPLEMYKMLDMYGKNLVTTEGSDWRVHRKLAAPSFGERNNELVFTESIAHIESLLGLWTGSDGRGNITIQDPSAGAMNFALYVISSAGFDVRVKWPHEEHRAVDDKEKLETVAGGAEGESMFVGSKIPPGHSMNYREALSELLHNIMWTQVIPPKYLPKSPFKIHRVVGEAVTEWGKYMDELYELKKRQVTTGDNKGGMDLFDALIRGSGIANSPSTTTLQKDDLLGNAFVLMLAGHETTANTLHFTLLYLAMNPSSQRNLQNDLDKTLNGKPPSEWRYDVEFPKLFNGMCAAAMNETLRLLQPVLNIPKSVAPGRSQQINIDGVPHAFPGGMHMYLCGAIHKNPKYWPPPPGATPEEAKQDVHRWRAERWIKDAKVAAEGFTDIAYDDEDLRGPSGEDTSSALYKPPKGAYIPFSDGFRSCIGRRFAQVEMLAAFAVIFSTYSVELAVEEWASDEEIARMPKGGEERKSIYAEAVKRGERVLRDNVASIVTLQLRGVTVPIRLVKRGEERFIY